MNQYCVICKCYIYEGENFIMMGDLYYHNVPTKNCLHKALCSKIDLKKYYLSLLCGYCKRPITAIQWCVKRNGVGYHSTPGLECAFEAYGYKAICDKGFDN